jgi:hypothetical protein
MHSVVEREAALLSVAKERAVDDDVVARFLVCSAVEIDRELRRR